MQPPERHRQVDPERAAQAVERFAYQLAVALRPWRDRSILERERFVGHEPRGIEVVYGAQPLTVRARAMRRVEGKGARRHLGHADAAIGARQASREQPIPAVVGVDDDDVLGELQRNFNRLGESPLDAGLEHEPIDDHVDRVIAPPIQLDVLVERPELTVHSHLREAARAKRHELLLELALPAADDRRQHVHPLVVRGEHHHVDDPLERLRGDLSTAQVAMRNADVGEEEAQVVVDLGDGPDGRSRIRAGRLLLDRDGR